MNLRFSSEVKFIPHLTKNATNGGSITTPWDCRLCERLGNYHKVWSDFVKYVLTRPRSQLNLSLRRPKWRPSEGIASPRAHPALSLLPRRTPRNKKENKLHWIHGWSLHPGHRSHRSRITVLRGEEWLETWQLWVLYHQRAGKS